LLPPHAVEGKDAWTSVCQRNLDAGWQEINQIVEGTTAAVEAVLKKGSTLDQMKKDKILADWDKKYANKFVTQDVFIETLYNSLTNQKNAAFVQHN
jgi:hypothetical protein